MCKSAMSEEDAAWTQTFVTVTPQDDGILREIKESVVVSGAADAPLHLDTENIVMRRSLMSNANNFTNSAELEPLERTAVECQTYLQGVPKVELPLAYKDEATQTLYMRSDRQGPATVQSFGDMIAVMNEKPLPEWKTTRTVQTTISFVVEGLSYEDITEHLQSNVDQAKKDESESIVREAERENAVAEVDGLLNFVIDRTLWMAEPEVAPRNEQKDAEAQTHIKYNNTTNKITTDHEVQTSLSCEPRDSNTMLLFEYKRAKSCCQSQLEDCLMKGVYPRIMIDDIIDKVIAECLDQINFPLHEAAVESLFDNPAEVTVIKRICRPKETACPVRKCPAKCVGKVCPKLNPRTRRTEDILLADNPSYVVRTPSSAETDPSLKPSCPPPTRVYAAQTTDESSRSFQDSSSSQSLEQMSSGSRRTLTTQEEEALGVLRSAFCHAEACGILSKKTER